MTFKEFWEKFPAFYIRMYLEELKNGYLVIPWETGRADIAQCFYYLTKKSKVDGITKKGNHQKYKAVDIAFIKITDIEIIGVNPVYPRDRLLYWHSEWEKEGGNKMVVMDGEEDIPHFD